MSEERRKRVTKSHFEGNFKALYEKEFGVVLGRTAEMTPEQFLISQSVTSSGPKRTQSRLRKRQRFRATLTSGE